MQLPIAATPSEPAADDLIRYYQHTRRLWTEHLAEPTLLDCGTAFANAQLSAVPEANCVLDAALSEGDSAAAAIEAVNQHYAAIGSRCASWTMNGSAPAARTRPLIDQLLHQQFQPSRTTVMHLSRATILPQPRRFQIPPVQSRLQTFSNARRRNGGSCPNPAARRGQLAASR